MPQDPSTGAVLLRDVTEDNLCVFFGHQPDPATRAAFAARWARILGDGTIAKTALYDGQVAGHVLSFERFGDPK